MQAIYSVNCMLCGRSSGQVRGGRFFRMPSAPPLQNRGRGRACGFCGGNVYLEHDDFGMAPANIVRHPAFQRRRAS